MAEGRVEAYRSLARAVASHYFLPGSDREDVLQEAMIALATADRDHDPARGEFGPYAKAVIHRRLTSALRTATRKRHLVLSEATGLEADVASSLLDPAVIYEAREEAFELLRRVREDLTPLERTCLISQINGLNHEEISRETGGTPSTNSRGYARYRRVSNALDRAHRKLAA